MSNEEIIGDTKSFLDKIFSHLKSAGFDNEEFKELDHIAYRTETVERYEELKKEFANFTCDSSEVMISGRLISVYRLKEPILYGTWKIECLELCAPKENNKHQEGLEHAEFVTKASLESFMQSHNNIQFDLKAFNKEINRELILEFDDCAVKFHEQSLVEIRGM